MAFVQNHETKMRNFEARDSSGWAVNMDTCVDQMEPDALVDIIRQAAGCDVSSFDEVFLAKSVARRIAASGAADAAEYGQRLADDRQEAETLLRSLLVCHSEFFREPLSFALLEALVLPELVRRKKQSGQREIRIWSAGCAAGQEAYSVAILLDELVAAREAGISSMVFGTDVSEANVAAARRGEYHPAAMQNVRLRHLDACFLRQGDSYRIASRIRERVDFSIYDLLDTRTNCPPACIFGDFDLVLCSNVMLYYRPEYRRVILGKVSHGLSRGGYFVTSQAEREWVQSASAFRALAPPAAVFEQVGGSW